MRNQDSQNFKCLCGKGRIILSLNCFFHILSMFRIFWAVFYIEMCTSVTYLGTVQVLMFLQEFICLLYCHFIVAIVKVIWRNMWDINTLSTATLKLSIEYYISCQITEKKQLFCSTFSWTVDSFRFSQKKYKTSCSSSLSTIRNYVIGVTIGSLTFYYLFDQRSNYNFRM